ncbi:hypothetical protein Trydic_g12539 [Trypoxylus dichotomus]
MEWRRIGEGNPVKDKIRISVEEILAALLGTIAASWINFGENPTPYTVDVTQQKLVAMHWETLATPLSPLYLRRSTWGPGI